MSLKQEKSFREACSGQAANCESISSNYVAQDCLSDHFLLLSASSRICFLKHSGQIVRGIVSQEPFSSLIFIACSSVKAAPHSLQFLRSSNAYAPTGISRHPR